MSDDHAFDLAEAHRRISNIERRGVITAVQGNSARVKLDEGWETDFLPVRQHHAGARFKSWSSPTVGEQVSVHSLSGEVEAGVIVRGLPSDAQPLPSTDPDVEVLGHADGYLDTFNHGTGERALTLPAGGRFTVTIGDVSLVMSADGFALAKGGDKLTVAAGEIRTTTRTVLNNGARPVAYKGGKDDAGHLNVDGVEGVLV